MRSAMIGLITASMLMEAAVEGAEGGATEATPTKPKKEKAPVEVVQIGDRQVEFPGKRKLQKESLFDNCPEVPADATSISLTKEQTPAVRLDFRNGESRTFYIPLNLLLKSAAHGMEQKLGDETAGEEDVDDMVLSVDDLIERLNKGEWTQRREGGGMAGTSVLMKALIEFTKKTPEQIKEFLKNKSQNEKIALRNSGQLKPIVDRLEAEKVSKAAKVDTDALLAGLGTAEAA
jgi:hypothetical protein